MADRASAGQLLESLATALAAVQLYEDPRDKPPFVRAVESLGEVADEALALDVHAESFSFEGEDLEMTQPAVTRLAQRLFLKNVASVALVRAPTPDEVVGFLLNVLAEAAEVHDFQTDLDMAHVSAFRTRDRALLKERGPGDDLEEGGSHLSRSDAVRAVLEEGAEPERYAERLIEELGGEPGAFAAALMEKYSSVVASVDKDDWVGRERVVQIFVEVFFALEQEHQLATLAFCLGSADEEPFQNFLDQFASHELAELSAHLNEASFTLLLDYSRVAADEYEQAAELLDLLGAAADVTGARSAVSAWVSARLSDVEDAVSVEVAAASNERIQDKLAELEFDAFEGAELLRGLLQVEERSYRLRRLIRIWAGKVTMAIRDGDYERATQWVDALADEFTSLNTGDTAMDEAFSLVATPDILALLTHGDPDEGSPQRRVLRVLAEHGGAPLVQMLAEEEDAAQRRALIQVVAEVARINPGPVAARLGDDRWYVVRNLVIALGKAARRHAAPPLIGQLRHNDERVRVEVLRALIPCLGRDAVSYLLGSLSDRSDRVKSTALSLMGSIRDDSMWKEVVATIERADIGLDERVALIKWLGEDVSSDSLVALERLAEKKAAMLGGARVLREEARRSLERRRRLSA